MRMETDFPFQPRKETMAFSLYSAQRHGSSVLPYPVIHMRGRARQHATARCLKALICVPVGSALSLHPYSFHILLSPGFYIASAS